MDTELGRESVFQKDRWRAPKREGSQMEGKVTSRERVVGLRPTVVSPGGVGVAAAGASSQRSQRLPSAKIKSFSGISNR